MELIRKSDALHAVLHNQGDAAVAAVQMIPSAWISCKDRQPEKSGTYLTIDMDTEFPYMGTLEYSVKWSGWNCCNHLDDEKQARAYEMRVTHWMPLPDAPEVDE